MVWFQCDACGEEIKKPKLPNHFRICSSYKLSCLDCGQTFNKQSVQAHTQCISEAEKYGPKGQGMVGNGTPASTKKEKPKPDVDINVGLSDRPPWFCSLCNTKATSQQTLLLHADGKKHRGKARAYVANQQAKPSDESAPTNQESNQNTPQNTALIDCIENKKVNGSSNETARHENPSVENDKENVSEKKRKIDASMNSGDEDVNQVVAEKTKKVKKAKKQPAQDGKEKKSMADKKEQGVENGAKKEASAQKKIKWKKLITAALKSSSDGALKMKKLRKLVLESLEVSGITVDNSEFKTTVELRSIQTRNSPWMASMLDWQFESFCKSAL